jgi:hypothetical protein
LVGTSNSECATWHATMLTSSAWVTAMIMSARQLDRLVDHGDVVVLGRELPRDVEPDLAGAADDDFHDGNVIADSAP